MKTCFAPRVPWLRQGRSSFGRLRSDAAARAAAARHWTRRIVTVAAGALLLAAGLVMLVTPGPGLLAVVAGLVLLSRHFAWAERLLIRMRSRAAAARAASRRQA